MNNTAHLPLTVTDQPLVTDRIDLGTIVFMDMNTGLLQFVDGSMTWIQDVADFRAMFDLIENIGVRVAKTDRFMVRCDAIALIVADSGILHLRRPSLAFSLGGRENAEALIDAVLAQSVGFSRIEDGSCLNLENVDWVKANRVGIVEPGKMRTGTPFARAINVPSRVSESVSRAIVRRNRRLSEAIVAMPRSKGALAAAAAAVQ